MAYSRWPSSSGSYAPITYVRGFPVDLTTLITALHVMTTVICALALAFNQGALWEYQLLFRTDTFWQGKVWTVFSDPFFHDIAQEHLLLVVNLYFFYHFGTEIERLIGRFSFGILYAALLVVPALACLLAAPFLPVPLGVRVPFILTSAHFAIFIGFTYIYPGALFFTGITARLVAILFITATTLGIIAMRAWPSLIPLGASLATVILILGFVGAGRSLSILDIWQSWREKRQDQKVQTRRATRLLVQREQEASVDAILDKISLQGIQSLTARERMLLEEKGTQLRDGEGKGR
jgi:hypothetical protein